MYWTALMLNERSALDHDPARPDDFLEATNKHYSPVLPALTSTSTGIFHLAYLSGRGRSHTQVVPDVHLSTQSPDFNDALAQKVIGFPLQTLLHPGLDVIVFIPDPQLDAI